MPSVGRLGLVALPSVADDIDAAALKAVIALRADRLAAALLGLGIVVLGVGQLAAQAARTLVALLAALGHAFLLALLLALGRIGRGESNAGDAQAQSGCGERAQRVAARGAAG